MTRDIVRDRTGAAVRYLRGPPVSKSGRVSRKGQKNDDPEHQFQVEVAAALLWAMPGEYEWTANAAGVRVSMNVAVKMKAAGVRRGWPDLQILFPTAVTRYIELKVDASLSAEQKAFRDRCAATGRDIWAVARTLADVQAVLLRWKVPLIMPLSFANRYQAPMWGRLTQAERDAAWNTHKA